MKGFENVRGVNLVDIDGKLIDSIALLKREQPVIVATIDGKEVNMVSGASDKDLFVFATTIVDSLVSRTGRSIPSICADIAAALTISKMAKNKGTYNPFTGDIDFDGDITDFLGF